MAWRAWVDGWWGCPSNLFSRGGRQGAREKETERERERERDRERERE